MKVYIGNYINWWGPYQIARLLEYVGVSEERCDKIGEYLNNTKLNDLCNWIHNKRNRKIKIHLDNYDTWNADHTLALIIHPLLVELAKDNHGIPFTDVEDAPHIGIGNKENEWDIDDKAEARWDYIISEMIYAFEKLIGDDDEYCYIAGTGELDVVKYKEQQSRIANGLRLFGNIS